MREKVVITRDIPDNAYEILKEHFELVVNRENRNLTVDEIKELIRDAFGIIPMVSDPIGKKVIDEAKKLKIIANYGVGINNVDIEYATERGIILTNTPGVLTQATAELGWALIMAAARRIVEADALVRRGEFTGFAPTLMLGKELYGTTLGIIGMGRIGSSVARMGRFGFNMRVVYFNRKPSDRELLVDAERVELDELLRISDVVIVCAPLNEHSRHLISKREFDLMKDDAVFVNIGRGEVVDTEALIETLRSGKLFACGLDVYENEPEFDRRLLEFDRCVLLPHIGSATVKTRRKMAEIVANNIVKVYKGDCPDFAVNGEKLCGAKG